MWKKQRFTFIEKYFVESFYIVGFTYLFICEKVDFTIFLTKWWQQVLAIFTLWLFRIVVVVVFAGHSVKIQQFSCRWDFTWNHILFIVWWLQNVLHTTIIWPFSLDQNFDFLQIQSLSKLISRKKEPSVRKVIEFPHCVMLDTHV